MLRKKFIRLFGVFGFAVALTLTAQGIAFAEIAELTTAPKVPAAIKRAAPTTVVVNFEAKELVGELASGVKYKFWTFNGTVPGPMVRVREGDTVEFHLTNHKDNMWPHNIDIHAVNGPGGGAAVNEVKPGEESVFNFKALNPGLYIYHCAAGAPSIPHHISNGMYGLLLVEPTKGLTKVDKEFYVFQSEFFAKPSGEAGVFELDFDKGMAEQSNHVVFNGRNGALMGDGVLKAKAGDNVRIYFGNIGPNSASSFHIIGEVFDKVYVEGSLGGTVNRNVQTTLVPSAGSTIVEFKINVPGNYLLVDHSIYRVAKGAVGILAAEGKDNPAIFKKVKGGSEAGSGH